jgi:hypothetical protein
MRHLNTSEMRGRKFKSTTIEKDNAKRQTPNAKRQTPNAERIRIQRYTGLWGLLSSFSVSAEPQNDFDC